MTRKWTAGSSSTARSGHARCIPMARVEVGMPIVVGHAGVRVLPVERSREVSPFGFMNSAVSSEKPKSISVKGVVDAIRATRADGKKVLLVGGPAIVHTGSAGHVARLIKEGWVQVLFAGNALATHDIEQAMYGTSLGVSLTHGEPIEHGHEHHLRAINTIRRLGGIARAVEKGVLTSGIMYECVKAGVDVVLGRLDSRRRAAARGDHRYARRSGPDAPGDPRRRVRALDRDGAALDRDGQSVAGLGQGGLRRHQPGDRDQAQRPRDVSDDRAGDRRRAVLAVARDRAFAAAGDADSVTGVVIFDGRNPISGTVQPVSMTEGMNHHHGDRVGTRILMCPPDHFAIEYEINPWMNVRVGSECRGCPPASGPPFTRRSWIWESPSI